ncbi:OmpA family protein [Bacteroidota bacterium]
MRKIFIVAFITFYFFTAFSKEDSLRVRYGVFGHFNLNRHSADFSQIPDCPSCSPGYESGSGTGFSFGGLFEYPISGNILFSTKVAYFDYSANLNKIEPTTVMYNYQSIEGEFEHNLDSYLASIGIEPGLKYLLFANFYLNLFFHAGFVIQSDYEQYEKIVKPSEAATFLDSNGVDTHSRIRNELSGQIQKASVLNFTLMPGISYELPLNRDKTFLLDFEAFYSLGLMSIVSSSEVKKWNANSVRVGLALKYSPKTTDFIIRQDTIKHIDTVYFESELVMRDKYKKGSESITQSKEEFEDYEFIKYDIKRTDTIYYPRKYQLDCEIMAVGVKEDGIEIPNPILRIEEFVSSKLQPLLNYVFFDESSFELFSKYELMKPAETNSFNESRLFHDSVLGVYYQVLNIIGSRMRQYPEAVLRITGCNDGYSSENNNKNLSMKRAETIKDYFLNIWNIDDGRLKIEVRNLPEKPSTPISQIEKIEENRRVELQSDEYEIVKPVFMTDTIRTLNIPVIRFKPTITSEAGLKQWTIKTRQVEDILKSFEINNSNVHDIDWNLLEDQKSIPRLNYPLLYRLIAEDVRGTKDTTLERFIEVENISVSMKRRDRMDDIQYEKYSLILFDFNKSDISYTNSKIIDFIKSRTVSNSKIKITGHTDRTGDDDYNLKLSTSRVLETQEALGMPGSDARGLGEIDLLFNNEIPEGRFYCRTVNITVETIMK